MQAHSDLESNQRQLLARMIKRARTTEWGRSHHYEKLAGYSDYAESVAVSPYDHIRQMVMRMIAGETDILWPGRVRNFAQSSGTSDGKSKYIPITPESFKRNHYRGASDVVAHYLAHHPESRVLDGAAFILGGSFANELDIPRGVCVGDLSANLIENINPIVNLLRVPSKHTALLEDWQQKLPALAREAAPRRVTNLSGVPSWFLSVLKEVLQVTGKSHIKDVWPHLEVFFHGGISFDPYREQYREIIGGDGINYVETYNASEGFFGVQDDPTVKAISLIVDAGVFYEFLPVGRPDAAPIPAWEVTQGEIYSLIITACNGLWRYPIGDTVRIESTSPLRITIAGRTKHFINAFGEELMVYNADRALTQTCEEMGCSVLNYTAAPLFENNGIANGRHQWLIEFEREPASLEEFADTLDNHLQEQNSDYQAKRTADMFLGRLSVTRAPRGLFDRWLASTGKLGGQRKVPRLCNDRRFIDPMLALLSQVLATH